MKHLKKFNESGIDGDGFVKKRPGCLSFRGAVEWRQTDLDKIKEFLNTWSSWTLRNNSIGFYMPYKDIESEKKWISIDSYQDDWFILCDYPFYYECDQIDGVINCLKTLLPKI